LWAARYDRDLADVLVLQDEVSQQIAKALQVELSPDQTKQIERQRTGDVAAFDLLLRANAEKNKATKDANARARNLLEQAIALDPAFSAAYAELSYVLFRDWYYAWADDADTLDPALAAAETAVALDPRSGLARARLAWVALWSGDHRRAVAEVEQAVALEPNSADVHAARAGVLGYAGELTSALDSAKQALRLDPHDYLTLLYSGIAQFAAGHLDDAVMSFTETASRNPDFIPAHFFLAASYAELERLDEARAEAAIVHRMSSGQPSRFDQMPFQDPLIKAQFLDGLRKAGLEAQAPVNAGTN
jgi:adenylate cyclase